MLNDCDKILRYRSVYRLHDAYKKLDKKCGQLLLENLEIEVDGAVAASVCRVGKKASMIIYKSFTTEDPNMLF